MRRNDEGLRDAAQLSHQVIERTYLKMNKRKGAKEYEQWEGPRFEQIHEDINDAHKKLVI